MSTVSRNEAVSLLKKYNKQEFHLRHAVTVEAVMRYFAQKQGCTPEEVDFWGIVGWILKCILRSIAKKRPSF